MRVTKRGGRDENLKPKRCPNDQIDLTRCGSASVENLIVVDLYALVKVEFYP